MWLLREKPKIIYKNKTTTKFQNIIKEIFLFYQSILTINVVGMIRHIKKIQSGVISFFHKNSQTQ